MKKIAGIQKRWIVNNLSIVILLVIVCIVVVSLSFTTYYYSSMQSGLESKAKTTTDFFSNYIGQSYGEYYQSCILVAQTFEEKDTLELQFIRRPLPPRRCAPMWAKIPVPANGLWPSPVP